MHIVLADGIALITHITDLHAMSGPVIRVIAGNRAHAKQHHNIAMIDMKTATRISIVNQAASIVMVILAIAITMIVLVNK
jgi:hypothetical protein